MLPSEILLRICSLLAHPADLVNLACCCTHLYDLHLDASLWKNLAQTAQRTHWKVITNSNTVVELKAASTMEHPQHWPSSLLRKSSLGQWFERTVIPRLEKLQQDEEGEEERGKEKEAQQERQEERKAAALKKKKVAVVESWKRYYVQQYLENNLPAPKNEKTGSPRLQSMFSSSSSSSSSDAISMLASVSTSSRFVRSSSSSWNPFKKRVYKIPMFGEGLEHSAKKLLYAMMWQPESPFLMTRLCSGVEGIGSGVGFEVSGKELNLAAMHKYEDRGVFSFDKVRPLWRQFFASADGLIFVVDNNSDPAVVESARSTLRTLVALSNEEEEAKEAEKKREEEGGEKEEGGELKGMTKSSAPLLVLLCTSKKKWMEEAEEGREREEGRGTRSKKGLLRAAELAETLGLTRIPPEERRWCIRSVCVEDMSGIAEALIWLSTNLP
ncbi:ADP-ribosylation factor [Balamuthia mandrillaris]